MERRITTEYYFNDPEAVSASLDYAREQFDELGTNLMEPSTERTTENIAELRGHRITTARDMAMLSARLVELQGTATTDADRELNDIITDSENLVEVK